ncbi:zeta toxin family protein [Burkholderia guangdongensis]|uniref:zeta toxin family protein n=1 Tax=Burkholderia guangdongensis TaxID=1792500 RepID=UPI0015CE5403|nr:zeta toxin family protein [Burkholderia guangdongensis]
MRPQVWVVAGPNGSGKTTFARKFLFGRLPVVNPDDIAEADRVSPVGAGRLAIRRQQALLEAKESFAFETTLSGRHELDLMKQAALYGYKVNLVFIALGTPDLSIGRIVQRVLDGGHDIPAVDVKRRYERSMKNLPDALRLADRAFLIDNARARPRVLISIDAGKLKRVGRDLPPWAAEALSKSDAA